MASDKAKMTAEYVISDLKDRSGIGNAFDQVDKKTMEEIVETLAKIIEKGMA